MHYMGISLNVHKVLYRYGTKFRYSSDIVSAQVHQHHMLGYFFLIGKSSFSKASSSSFVLPLFRVPAIGQVSTFHFQP